MYPVEIFSERLRLREFTAADIDDVLKIYGDPVATRHLSFEPRDREQVEKTISHVLRTAHDEPRTEYNLAAVRLDNEQLIGFTRIAVEAHKAGQIGFALRSDQWGSGFGLETVKLLLKFGFQELKLHRMWGARSPINAASDRVMTKAGMAEEGRIRHHVFAHGVWRDSITHAILEDEWRHPMSPEQ